jgi:hypothetical protein
MIARVLMTICRLRPAGRKAGSPSIKAKTAGVLLKMIRGSSFSSWYEAAAPGTAFRKETMRSKLDARLQKIRARMFSTIAYAAFGLAPSVQDLL